MHIKIISQPRSGSNFLIDNIKTLPDTTVGKNPYAYILHKDFTQKIFESRYVVVLRNPLDVAVSSIIQNSVVKEISVEFSKDAFYSIIKKYESHLKGCVIDEVLKFDFNDLVSQPRQVLSKITDVDFTNRDLIEPQSHKKNPDYENVYQFAMDNLDIFKDITDLYQEALLKTIKF